MSDLDIDMHNASLDAQVQAIDTQAENEMAEIADYNAEEYMEDLPTEEEAKQLAFDDWCEANYYENRSNFREYAVEMWVSPDSDDGREEFCKSEYNIYLSNTK